MDFPELIALALRTRKERARRIIDHCMTRVPHYQQLPAAVLDDVFESTVYHQEIFYAVTLSEDRPMTDEELAPSREAARSRSRLGVPLGEYLLFFHEGLRVIVEELVEGARGDAARGELLARLPRIIGNQTQLMTALTEAYVEERERLSHFRDQELYDFFELLLHRESSSSLVSLRARALGISLDGEHCVVLFQVPATPPDGAAEASGLEALRSALAVAGEEPGWVGRSREGFAALLRSAPDASKLGRTGREVLGEGALLGVGRPGSGVEGARRSAQEALRAVRIGSLLGGERAAVGYDEVEILDLVGVGSPAAETFMRRALGPLAEPGANRSYLETLRALAATDFAIKPAAEALGVHPHTLTYRTKQIRRRCGLALDDPGTRLRLQIALRILDASAVSEAGLESPR